MYRRTKRMMFWALMSVLSVQAYSAPVNKEKDNRTGKFMRFGNADDLFSDVLDEMQDPLSGVEEFSVENVSDRVKDSPHHTTQMVYHANLKNATRPTKAEGQVALYNENKGKYELITSSNSGHFMLPANPVTENGVIFYGGQHYQYHKPGAEEPSDGNRTGEIKFFWGSVTDAIQNLPFIPVQVNVPDMISAMANFLTTSIPIINRFTNPNQPRLPPRPDSSAVNSHKYPYLKWDYGTNDLDDNGVEDRELKGGAKANGGKSKKQKNGQKRKNSTKRKHGKNSNKGLVTRPIFRRTTEAPQEDKRVWHAFGSGGPTGTNMKNMPITRRKFLIRDKENFNFKNSNISNSPIMILNLPERPLIYHKTQVHQRVGGGKKTDTSGNGAGNMVNEQIPPGIARPKNNKQNQRKTVPKRVRNVPKVKGGSAEKSNSN